VLLGAGFDTTAFRMQVAQPVTIFEVDAPTTQNAKRRAVTQGGLTAPNEVRWVPCDFEQERLSDRLRQAGFDRTQPCVVVWLGVSMYLSRLAFDHTLCKLAESSAPNSLLVFDYGDPELVTENHPLASARRTSRLVRHRGEPYKTGFTQYELTATLAQRGYTVRDHTRVPDLMKRYSPTHNAYATDDWFGIATAERQQS
jgi:methyltransferase (TIGR00027 family)